MYLYHVFASCISCISILYLLCLQGSTSILHRLVLFDRAAIMFPSRANKSLSLALPLHAMSQVFNHHCLMKMTKIFNNKKRSTSAHMTDQCFMPVAQIQLVFEWLLLQISENHLSLKNSRKCRNVTWFLHQALVGIDKVSYDLDCV